jgi:4-hydroxybutyrate dehydrogenase/sulfolactaldehyde 3-reductase
LDRFYKASIGFLGLGNMGKHMATNLIAAKHHVTIFDVNPQALDHFKDQSKDMWFFRFSRINLSQFLEQAKMVSVPQNAVENSEFVVLMLPNGKIVRDVCQSTVFP